MELAMADEETTPDEEPQKSGGLKKMLIFGVAGIALLAAGIFLGPMVMGPDGGEEGADAEVSEDAPAENDGPAIYQGLEPPLVVNLTDSSGAPHFMQVTMEVMARDQEIINSVREHTPAIRNALILMLGGTEYEAVTTREGKEALLDTALQEIRAVMTDRVGEPGIEEVYFTTLVIQ